MVSSPRVELDLDTSQAKAELRELREINDRVSREAIEARKEVEKTAHRGAAMGMALIGLFRSLTSAFGVTIGAMGQAILSTVTNIIALAEAYTALQVALVAGSGGTNVVAWAGYIAAAAAVGLSLAAIVTVQAGIENANEKVEKMEGVVDSLLGVVQAGRY